VQKWLTEEKSNCMKLITDAATGTVETPRGLRAILTQVDKNGNFYTVSFASRQTIESPQEQLLTFSFRS
jgi:hypothetical protein